MASIACFCCYLLFFVVFLQFECFAINLDDATKEFIKCMLENQDATCGICDPPRENRDKGDSTLTTHFYSKTKEFGFSTLKACSRAHFIIKLLCLVGHTKNKRACSH